MGRFLTLYPARGQVRYDLPVYCVFSLLIGIHELDNSPAL